MINVIFVLNKKNRLPRVNEVSCFMYRRRKVQPVKRGLEPDEVRFETVNDKWKKEQEARIEEERRDIKEKII